MKKHFAFFVSAFVSIPLLVACGSNSDDQASGDGEFSPDDPVDVTIGVTGTDTPQWDYISELAAEEGINITIQRFNDYVQPNLALDEGELDANAFQTVSYFDNFVEEHHLSVEAIGSTVIAPMGLYSDRYESVEDIPDGAEITIDQEVTNQARNLMLLEQAGLLELDEDFGVTSGVDQITNNPKNIQLTQISAGNAPRVMQDVDASVINNGFAVDAGLIPVEDAIYLEDETATPYINIIAAQSDNTGNPALQRIVEIYQSDEVARFIEEEYQGAQIPTAVSLEELNSYPR
ncbi:MetQ/NlpA family ABC transporter substrate-binding protein [Shouchella shacheensis]|uniref:MetQ/NlpA family ABC transporter substrate-binding protein n=1 Tax=Shouchella shacheensis TaxID=1649580 RepID=UPI00073FF9FC|nr:MetQ/NlpA family ABC transporter substrate-binding protein [Shouchella shacheensis]